MEPQAWWGIFECSGWGFAIGAPDGTFITMNPAYAEMHGYSVEELVGKPVATVVAPEWREKLPELFQASHDNGHLSLELVHERKDGTPFPIQADVVVAKDADGRVLYRAVWVQDISERKRAEEALRLQSEILENITEAVYLIRASDGVIVYTNPSFERLFGYRPGELIGTHVSVLNAPTKKSPEKTAREIIAALDRTGVWRGEILNIKKDGTPFWCAANVSTFDHPTHGSVWVTYHTDITERKRAEDALRASKLLQEKTFESLDEVVFIVEPANRTIIACNAAAEHVFGYSEEEMLGRNTEFLHVDRAMYEEFGRKLLPALEADGVLHTDYQARRKDGTVIATDHTVTEIVDDSGRRTGLVSVIRDITERKQAEEALRESEERYRVLYTKTPTMLYSIDTAGRVLAVNDRWLEVFGYERNEVIGRNVVGFLTDDSRRFAETVGGPRFWKAGSVRDVPYQFVKKSGDLVDILLSAVVERDGAGNAVSSLAVLDDVTDRNRLEEALQRAREELEGKIERQMVQRNPYRLTFREFTILHLVSTGRADKEIASELVISPLTVHKHVANILAKMDAASRTEAGVRALREGWLD